VAANALSYAPRYPLWSNGSVKLRQLVLPAGESVDTRTSPWEFPVGTLLFKTFAFADDAAEDGLRYVETRVLRRGEERWDYAVYRWRDDREDADLLDGMREQRVEVELEGETFEHAIPSRRQCRACHESSPSPVLGLDPLQLGHDDGFGGRSALERLHDEGALDRELEPPPPLADDERAEAVLGYVAGNCTHCHNGWGEGANSVFDLRPDAFLANTVQRDTESSGSGIGVRIVPGEPRHSVLYLAFTGEDNGTGIEPMPPLGVQRRDAEAARLLERFIAELPAPESH
jgi:hypothetical protein